MTELPNSDGCSLSLADNLDEIDVIKQRIQELCNMLEVRGEQTLVLTANPGSRSFGHLGSQTGIQYLHSLTELDLSFAKFCADHCTATHSEDMVSNTDLLPLGTSENSVAEIHLADTSPEMPSFTSNLPTSHLQTSLVTLQSDVDSLYTGIIHVGNKPGPLFSQSELVTSTQPAALTSIEDSMDKLGTMTGNDLTGYGEGNVAECFSSKSDCNAVSQADVNALCLGSLVEAKCEPRSNQATTESVGYEAGPEIQPLDSVAKDVDDRTLEVVSSTCSFLLNNVDSQSLKVSGIQPGSQTLTQDLSTELTANQHGSDNQTHGLVNVLTVSEYQATQEQSSSIGPTVDQELALATQEQSSCIGPTVAQELALGDTCSTVGVSSLGCVDILTVDAASVSGAHGEVADSSVHVTSQGIRPVAAKTSPGGSCMGNVDDFTVVTTGESVELLSGGDVVSQTDKREADTVAGEGGEGEELARESTVVLTLRADSSVARPSKQGQVAMVATDTAVEKGFGQGQVTPTVPDTAPSAQLNITCGTEELGGVTIGSGLSQTTGDKPTDSRAKTPRTVQIQEQIFINQTSRFKSLLKTQQRTFDSEGKCKMASLLKPGQETQNEFDNMTSADKNCSFVDCKRNLSTGQEPCANNCNTTHNEQKTSSQLTIKESCKSRPNKELKLSKEKTVSQVCEICGKAFTSASLLKRHERRHKSKEFCCEVCGMLFKTSKWLQNHIETHKMSENVCKKCGQAVEGSQDIPSHVCVVKPSKSFACKHCDKTFCLQSTLINHRYVHFPVPKCKLCSRRFKSQEALDEHKASMHSDSQVYYCDACGKELKTMRQLRDHHRVEHTDKWFNCDSCDFAAKTRSSLNQHKVNRHSNVFQYKCDQCDKQFKRKQQYKEHYRKHTGELPHQCSMCDRAFRTREVLLQHENKHTGAKKFVCDYCGKIFLQRSHLRNHLAIHTREKQFSCKFCGERFFSNCAVKTHLFSAHNTQASEQNLLSRCKICDKVFAHKKDYLIHMNKHTGDRPHKCEVCSKTFSDPSNLRQHMLTHGGEKKFGCPICLKPFLHKRTVRTHLKSHGEAGQTVLQATDVKLFSVDKLSAIAEKLNLQVVPAKRPEQKRKQQESLADVTVEYPPEQEFTAINTFTMPGPTPGITSIVTFPVGQTEFSINLQPETLAVLK